MSLFYNAVSVGEDIDAQKDAHAADHYVFPPEGCKGKRDAPKTPKHELNHTFKFKDYAPKIFHRIRLLSGIDTQSCECLDGLSLSFATGLPVFFRFN